MNCCPRKDWITLIYNPNGIACNFGKYKLDHVYKSSKKNDELSNSKFISHALSPFPLSNPWEIQVSIRNVTDPWCYYKQLKQLNSIFGCQISAWAVNVVPIWTRKYRFMLLWSPTHDWKKYIRIPDWDREENSRLKWLSLPDWAQGIDFPIGFPT